jgi:hypothetical protein
VPASAPTRAPSDEVLLRAHEPVLRFTSGELILPTVVGPYVARRSLRADGRDGGSDPVLSAGELSLERLAESGVGYRDRPLYLRFVDGPLTGTEVRAWRREGRPRLRSASRFAAVDVLARLVDVLFRLSLLVRGRVPGGGRRRRPARPGAPRRRGLPVLRPGRPRGRRHGLPVLVCLPVQRLALDLPRRQRPRGRLGTVAVFLVADHGRLRAAWAASSHDHDGEALRRRWDDPGIRRAGDHPVVWIAPGLMEALICWKTRVMGAWRTVRT